MVFLVSKGMPFALIVIGVDPKTDVNAVRKILLTYIKNTPELADCTIPRAPLSVDRMAELDYTAMVTAMPVAPNEVRYKLLHSGAEAVLV